MKQINLPLASTTWDADEISAMTSVIESGNFTMGENVQEFENLFASQFGSKYAVMSNSGSSANLLALAAMKYRKASSRKPERDEIIVPAVSWSTTYYPVHQLGYKLRFVDVELDSLNASASSIKAAINPRTAGIFAVNLLGNPSELIEIRQLADENDIFLLEDNCESMGARLEGQEAGTFGHIGTFSTFFSHHISTMEGGMSLTDDEELSQIMISMRAHGWTRGLPDRNHVWNKSGDPFSDSFTFVLPGYNLRPLELSGAIGKQQLQKIPSIVAQRRANAKTFQSRFGQIPGVSIQHENGESSWFGFSIILAGHNLGRRKELLELLSEANVQTRPIVAGDFTRNPVIKLLNHATLEEYPNASMIHDQGFFIGNHHYSIIEELDAVSELLRDFSAR